LRGLIRPVLIARAFDTDGFRLLQAGIGLLQKSNLLLVASGSVVIGVCGDELIALLSGNKFNGGGLTLLLMYMALASTSQRTVIEMVMQITGQTKALRLTSYLAPIALLCVWIMAYLGLNAAIVIIMLFAALANWLAMSQLVKHSDVFTIDWLGLIRVIGSTAVSIASGLLLKIWLHPVVAAALSLVLFLFFIWLAKPLHPAERVLIEKSLGSRAGRFFQPFTGA
jgi:hypothetical protein